MTSKIEWTDETWNPVTGCTKVSDGCKHCYAERMWKRLSAPNMPYEGRKFTDIRCHDDRLDQPLRWRRPRKIFVNSMSDLFHEDVPDDFIHEVFAVMTLSNTHTFQILTKRPERMFDFMAYERNDMIIEGIAQRRYFEKTGEDPSYWLAVNFPLPNVWLGVSVEDQATADKRIPLLLQTPAAVRWLSAEPLLGPVYLDKLLEQVDGQHRNSLTGKVHGFYTDYKDCPKLDWVVVGGESGPKARPMHPDWVRDIRDQCKAAGVPFLFKQWGEWAPDCLCNTEKAHPDIPRPEPGKMGCMFKCGKKKAGRTLDCTLYDGYPG